MTVAATWMLARPRRRSSLLVRLQLTASAVTTLLTLAVAGLASVFWRVPTDEVGYRILAIVLVGLLVVPLVTLGTAAARLTARSRDDRLATLRLLGVSGRGVRFVAVAESTAVAAAGVLVGTVLGFAVPFALSLLTVHGEPLSPGDLRPPFWLHVAIPPALVLVTALSSLLGLRRVTISPLGVRTRSDAPRMSLLRPVVAGLVVVAAVVVSRAVSPGWGVAVAVASLTAVLLAVMAVLGVVGPFVVSVVARRHAVGTSDGARVIAMRGIADDPRASWRQVSAVALTSFVLVPAGSLLGYLDVIRASASGAIMTPEQLLLFTDARTMLIAVVAVSFLVVTCQVAITQAAAVVERRDLFVALDRTGIPVREMMRARRLAVTMPATIAVVGSASAALTLGFPLPLIVLVNAPAFGVAVVLLLTLGILLIRAGVRLTEPVLRTVLDSPRRGE